MLIVYRRLDHPRDHSYRYFERTQSPFACLSSPTARMGGKELSGDNLRHPEVLTLANKVKRLEDDRHNAKTERFPTH